MDVEMDYIELRLQLAEVGLQFINLLRHLQRIRKKYRRWWSKPLIRQNYLTGYGGYERVFRYFHLQDEEEFIVFTRMNVQIFMYVYNLVRDRLIKRSKRPPLPSELRFSLTLHYLGHGDSMKKNAWFYNIGLSTMKQIIPEVCDVLCNVLVPLFVKFPTREEFKAIANDFMRDLHFPHCIGAIDGKHCSIKKPPRSGSLFYNYKKFFSVVLMACCDSKKRFIWVNVGDYGSLNDAGIFANSDFGRALSANEIQLPQSVNLPNTETLCPYFLIGDGGFPLKKYLMKPFIRNANLTMPRRAFNYRLSHARRIIESAFGQLAQKWLVYQLDMAWKLQTTERIIISTICLHNILIDFECDEVLNRWQNIDNNEMIINAADRNIEGDLQSEHRIREGLCAYFISPAGYVPWQWARM